MACYISSVGKFIKTIVSGGQLSERILVAINFLNSDVNLVLTMENLTSKYS